MQFHTFVIVNFDWFFVTLKFSFLNHPSNIGFLPTLQLAKVMAIPDFFQVILGISDLKNCWLSSRSQSL
jgi:hypothetical protein